MIDALFWGVLGLMVGIIIMVIIDDMRAAEDDWVDPDNEG
jgi:hypothetical protein